MEGKKHGLVITLKVLAILVWVSGVVNAVRLIYFSGRMADPSWDALISGTAERTWSMPAAHVWWSLIPALIYPLAMGFVLFALGVVISLLHKNAANKAPVQE